MREFNIGKRIIGINHKPFIIAELSGNHNQSLSRALSIVKAAADCGADALKLQTYTADTLTIDHTGGLFDIDDQNSPWFGKTLYQLYKEAYTPWEWHKEIFAYANELGMEAFASPFDETAVDFLEDLNVPAYKIASFESNHHPLLKKVASTGKPVIISSGASKIEDLKESVAVLQDNGCDNIIILKCTSTYPANPKNSNLVTIKEFQKIFSDDIIGLSDHTLGIGAAIAAVALGARVVEKHFTLSRADGGVDSTFSMEPEEMKNLVVETERAFLSLGEKQLDTQKSEETSLRFKRSIYVVNDISKGEIFTPKNLRIIRPGDGAHPRYLEKLIGTKALSNIKRGTPLKEPHYSIET